MWVVLLNSLLDGEFSIDGEDLHAFSVEAGVAGESAWDVIIIINKNKDTFEASTSVWNKSEEVGDYIWNDTAYVGDKVWNGTTYAGG